MNKKILITAMTAFTLVLTACGGSGNANSGSKTVSTKEEAEAMTKEFFEGFLDDEQIKMATYSNEKIVSTVTKDGDKMHIVMNEAGYDYYCFVENGEKYVITDTRAVMKDEATYDMSQDMINMVLSLNVTGQFEADNPDAKYTASNKDGNELNLQVTGKNEGQEYMITTTSKKENGKVTEIISEIASGDQKYSSNYKFTYGESVVLPEYTMPKAYDNLPHVDSPYQIYGEIIDKHAIDEMFSHTVMNNVLVVIDEVAGRHLQFSSLLDDETVEEYNKLDFMAEDYEQQVRDFLYYIEIDDCIDFTDELIPQEQLDGYYGKQVKDLLADGFEVTGYSFFEDHNIIYADKDMMTYRVDVDVPFDFDVDGEYDYDAFNEFTIEQVQFDSPEPAILPMQ